METTKTHAANRSHRYLAILLHLALVIGLQFMAGCSVFQTGKPDTLTASLQNQRTEKARSALLEMENIDTLIRLDNHWLADRFESALKTPAALEGTYDIRKIETIFTNQIILLEAIVDITDEYEHTISATVWGDVLLLYRDDGLEWRPRFNELQIDLKDFNFAGNSYVEPGPELTQTLLRNLNRDIAQTIVESNANTISLNPIPLGEIQVGASLPGFAETVARSTHSLRGVFRTAGSATLIESSATSIALDLAFIPDLSTCPADITISRAEFARDVKSREPVGITRNLGGVVDAGYFYTEITGATHPMTIIHYWFADGLPVAVEELPVGASERWRTWSSKGAANSGASQWEVLVVEKESGCILTSKSIRKLEPETPATTVSPDQARQAFTQFREEFIRRTSGFSIIHDKPGIVLIETRRSFLREVLQASLAGLSIDAAFDPPTLSSLQFSAQLQSFDPANITCEHRDCSPVPVCKVSLNPCKRLRDTRDCSSCQFRNPLNNRCVSEAVDPLCEAARKRQNARYDDERNACINHAENAKRECDRLNAQVFSSCQIESGFEESACEAVKTSLKALETNAPLAIVRARVQPKGNLTANFSNFILADNLDGLKLDMSLQSRLQLEGDLYFEPTPVNGPLSKCIAAWSTPFVSGLTGTGAFRSLLSEFEQGPDMLTADWSGFGITTETRPSPLGSIFVDNPQLLADCKIGLTVSRVEQAITGDDAAFFRGQAELILQALPTKIHLAPATVASGNRVHSARARLTAQHLQYDIQE